MTTFDLGSGCRVTLETLIDTRLLVQANSGGGKSWALRRLLEQTHGQVQHLVLDPEGEFSTLRERYDYVLAARQHGDTIADPRSAKLLAERLLELGVSALLDIYELKAHDRIRFVRLFLEALVDAPKRLWHPCLIVVDEAHVFCPQAGEAESAGAVIDLATRGRKRGFCAVLATQRLSKLHKDAAAECNNKLVGRTGLDVDVKRVADELGFGKDRHRELRELAAGDFFAFGPALTPEVRRIRVGPVRTSHPKAGSRIAFAPPPPTAKVKALLPKLADLPAEAEARQRSIEELTQANAQLRRELTLAQRAQPPAPAPLPPIEVPVLTGATLAELEAIAEKTIAAITQVGQLRRELEAAWQSCKESIESGRILAARVSRGTPVPVSSSTPSVAWAVAPPAPRPAARVDRASPPSGTLTGPEQRILDAIAWLEQLGVDQPEQPAVAFLAGYTFGGGAFNNPRGALRTKGLVEYAGAGIRLTEAGRALARVPDAPLSTEELHRRVLERLPGPEQRILRPLLEAFPRALANEDLAAAAGYAPGAGAFNNPRGRLRTLGLIEYPQPGHAVARPLLFLEAR